MRQRKQSGKVFPSTNKLSGKHEKVISGGSSCGRGSTKGVMGQDRLFKAVILA